MADILDEISAALASGKEPDEATMARLVAGAQAELGHGKAAGPPRPAPDMATITRDAGPPVEQKAPEDFDEWYANYQHKQGLPDTGIESFLAGGGAAASKALNAGTLGAYNGARRLIMGDEPARQQIDRENRLLASNPISNVGGGLAEQAGGGALLGPAASGLAGMLEQAVPRIAGNAVGRAGIQAATGGLISGTAGAGEAASEGAGPGEIAKRAGKSALFGAALGGGLGGIGEAVGAARDALRNPNSELGQTTLLYDKAKREGRLPKHFLQSGDDPPLAAEVRNTPPGRAGTNQVADTVAQEMATLNNKTAKGATVLDDTAEGDRALWQGVPFRSPEQRLAEVEATKGRLARANDLVFGIPKPVLPERTPGKLSAATERAAAARLSPAGEENNLRNPSPAARQRQRTELGTLDPAYPDMLARIDAKDAYEKTRLPGIIESAKKIGLATPIKDVLNMLGDYGTGLAARVGDPALQGLQNVTSKLKGAIPEGFDAKGLGGANKAYLAHEIEDAVATARMEKARQEAQRKLDAEKVREARRKKYQDRSRY